MSLGDLTPDMAKRLVSLRFYLARPLYLSLWTFKFVKVLPRRDASMAEFLKSEGLIKLIIRDEFIIITNFLNHC